MADGSYDGLKFTVVTVTVIVDRDTSQSKSSGELCAGLMGGVGVSVGGTPTPIHTHTHAHTHTRVRTQTHAPSCFLRMREATVSAS